MSTQNSSSDPTEVQHPQWAGPHVIATRVAGFDYGCVIKGESVGCTPQQLIKRVENGYPLDLVWTPDTPEPVPPEEVPFLLPAFRTKARKSARNAILWGVGFLTIPVVIAVALEEWSLLYRSFFFVIGAAGLAEGLWQYARSRNYSHEDARSDAGTTRFTAWLEGKNISGYTVALIACMVVVGAAQVFVDNSIRIAGLVKPPVWNGEVWRLFTSTLMHANGLHFWMNLAALMHFSKIVEQTVHRASVPLVFLVTGPVGSIFSVLFYPNSISIGASGGLMGLLGFITIAAYFDRTRFPPKYFRRTIEAIVLVAVFGLLGFAFIDNAAHFGGLVGGLLFGWLLFRRNERWIRESEKALKFGGLGALFVLAFIAAFAVYRITR